MPEQIPLRMYEMLAIFRFEQDAMEWERGMGFQTGASARPSDPELRDSKWARKLFGYRSRVTLEPSMVLWLRPGGRDLESEICRSLDGSGAIHSDRDRSGRPAIYKRGSPSCPPPISKYEVSAADIGEFSRQDQRGTTDSRSGPTGIRTLNQRIMSPLL
jgi:hypothetical protein